MISHLLNLIQLHYEINFPYKTLMEYLLMLIFISNNVLFIMIKHFHYSNEGQLII